MNKLIRYFLALLIVAPVYAQTALTNTTLTAAITAGSQRTIQLASVTGIVAPSPQVGSGSLIYIDNEAMTVSAVSGTLVTVVRGVSGTRATLHASGSGVLLGPGNAFLAYDPHGACTAGTGLFLYSPIVNVNTGNQWLCSTVTGTVVPGFGNSAAFPGVTAVVASAAGAVTPSGLLFHITGALAITGFTLPVGFSPMAGATICAVPDGAFTTTTAGNIGKASTGVVGVTLCWTYDPNSTKFYPSY